MIHRPSHEQRPGREPLGRIHASCVLVGESAVLVRGAAGSGKTSLCLELLDASTSVGLFSRFLADDRVELACVGGRLLARAVPATAGLIERRGLGLTPIAHEPAAIVRLVVDLVDEEPPRLPEPEDLVANLESVVLPRLAVLRQSASARHVLAALALFNDEAWLR